PPPPTLFPYTTLFRSLKSQALSTGGSPGFQFVLLSFTPGPSRAANITGFRRSMTGFCRTVQQSTCVVVNQRPNGITNYASIDARSEEHTSELQSPYDL